MIQTTSSSLKIENPNTLNNYWGKIVISIKTKNKEKKISNRFITQVSIGLLSTIIIRWIGTLIAFNAPNPFYSSYMILLQVYKLITFCELYGNKSLEN
jgi:hypothetical protein